MLCPYILYMSLYHKENVGILFFPPPNPSDRADPRPEDTSEFPIKQNRGETAYPTLLFLATEW